MKPRVPPHEHLSTCRGSIRDGDTTLVSLERLSRNAGESRHLVRRTHELAARDPGFRRGDGVKKMPPPTRHAGKSQHLMESLATVTTRPWLLPG